MNWRPRRSLALLTLALGAAGAGLVHGEVYQEPDAFVAEVFGSKPAPKVLWLTRDLQAQAAAILGHAPAQLRQRYWSDSHKSVWILEEIGKEEPITAGFVVVDGRIDHVRVLVYRESRGQEVRHPSFLRQFGEAKLARGDHLDREIDGIAGATLSVGAMERMARLALFFDRTARK
ncbi:MAG TPA: FMN-binding protein [Burkholderiales bacterium]|nr:FMN-binding protein [Burkholderiales bacterium]